MHFPRLSALPVKAALLGMALSGFCAFSSAQDSAPKAAHNSTQRSYLAPEVNIFAGYSFLRYDSVPLGFSDKLNLSQGGNVEVSLPHLYQGLGVVVDVSGHWSDQLKSFNFMAGPQYRFEVKRIDLFGHLLIGKSRSRLLQVGNSLLQPSSLGGAVALGGGADIPIGKRFSVRVIQADYIINSAFGDRLHNVRYSSGLVIDFGKKSSPPSF